MAQTPQPMHTLHPETITLRASCATVTTGTPGTVRGKGLTFARTATGTYTVTPDSKYPNLLYAHAHLQRPSVDSARAIIGPFNATTKVLTVYLVAEDGTPAAADPANDANSRLHVEMVFSQYDSLD